MLPGGSCLFDHPGMLACRGRDHDGIDLAIREQLLERGRPGDTEPLSGRLRNLFRRIDHARDARKRAATRHVRSVHPADATETDDAETNRAWC